MAILLASKSSPPERGEILLRAAGDTRRGSSSRSMRFHSKNRSQPATGRRDADAAVRRALDQSLREEREGKVRRFKTATDAVAHLNRQ